MPANIKVTEKEWDAARAWFSDPENAEKEKYSRKSGYEVCLMPKNENIALEEGKIYLRPDGSYVIQDQGEIHEGSLKNAYLKDKKIIDLNGLSKKVLDKDKTFIKQVIEITGQRGHTRPHSFVKKNGIIYALANTTIPDEGYFASGGCGKLKVCMADPEVKLDDNYFAYKVEGDTNEEGVVEQEIMIKGKTLQAAYTREETPSGEKYKSLTVGGKQKPMHKKKIVIQKLYRGKDLLSRLYGKNPDGKFFHKVSPTLERLIIAKRACESIKMIHELGYIHADIKPGNFMISGQGNDIVIDPIDFGFSLKNSDQLPIINKGTFAYMPPLEYQERFSFASDIYALGIMLQQDLQLNDFLYAGMTSLRPEDRPVLDEIIKHLDREIMERQLILKRNEDNIKKRKEQIDKRNKELKVEREQREQERLARELEERRKQEQLARKLEEQRKQEQDIVKNIYDSNSDIFDSEEDAQELFVITKELRAFSKYIHTRFFDQEADWQKEFSGNVEQFLHEMDRFLDKIEPLLKALEFIQKNPTTKLTKELLAKLVKELEVLEVFEKKLIKESFTEREGIESAGKGIFESASKIALKANTAEVKIEKNIGFFARLAGLVSMFTFELETTFSDDILAEQKKMQLVKLEENFVPTSADSEVKENFEVNVSRSITPYLNKNKEEETEETEETEVSPETPVSRDPNPPK